ncbi:glycosyltransferase [Sphingomonas sp. TZW2008]|uniref:glycosyltransferase n=1 Tax=Sphingomonas sp. TZW2008 TaxID=1917973 RepID=UPI0015C509D4|nr:glycosyltransferase [Sphingomonas sp. TZW2008]
MAAAHADARDSDRRPSAPSGYPIAAYDLFRRDIPVRPPPPQTTVSRASVLVVVDALTAQPYLLRETLRSLQDQSHHDWQAIVAAPATVRDHPVGAFATTDRRMSFVECLTPSAREDQPDYVVVIDAGTTIDPEALAWLTFALQRTGAAAAIADHDRGVTDPVHRILRADPGLHGIFDPTLRVNGSPPLVATMQPIYGAIGEVTDGATLRSALVATAGMAGTIAAVPRVLATRLELPLIARAGAVEDSATAADTASSDAIPARDDTAITVVIPTRDSPALLSRAITSLRSTARAPERLEFIVIDNRSRADESMALFTDLVRSGVARVTPLDAPFNWSLACNLGAAAGTTPLLAFVNDDIEMLSAGWDDALAATLSDTAVGALGARLLYPNATVQHAGMVFGFGPTGVEHEGRGAKVDERGPGGRYVEAHDVSAVTGAFLAVRRETFDDIGGFDAARLMVAHSDVDLCLKVRQRGLVVRYCPAIEAIHAEGATRGVNRTQSAIAWDEGERGDLIERWGEALREDPGVSPYWQRSVAPFAMLREPSMREILAHIDRSVQPMPWRPLGIDADEIHVA